MKFTPTKFICATAAIAAAWLTGVGCNLNIPTADDATAAYALLKHVREKVLLDTSTRSFASPAAEGFKPTLIFYKITDKAVQDSIVAAASEYPDGSRFKKVRLQFFKEQRWQEDKGEDGRVTGGHRLPEELLREELVTIKAAK